MGRLFGTDGVRGVANSELTPELAFKLGKAGAHVLSKKKGKPVVLIGKDTRISGDMLEDALSAGILAVGGNVIKVGVLPTPAVAYLVKYYQADVGVVISASHNPFEYNGIKFFFQLCVCMPHLKCPADSGWLTKYIPSVRGYDVISRSADKGNILYNHLPADVTGLCKSSACHRCFAVFYPVQKSEVKRGCRIND